MIEYIKKNKDLKDLFTQVENQYVEEKTRELYLQEETESAELIEVAAVEKPKKEKAFYKLICEDFVADILAKDFKYDESLIRVKISFSKGEPRYRLAFPLLETSETQSQSFVNSLKLAIKKHIDGDYSINLCLKKEHEVNNIILVLEKSEVKYLEPMKYEEA